MTLLYLTPLSRISVIEKSAADGEILSKEMREENISKMQELKGQKELTFNGSLMNNLEKLNKPQISTTSIDLFPFQNNIIKESQEKMNSILNPMGDAKTSVGLSGGDAMGGE